MILAFSGRGFTAMPLTTYKLKDKKEKLQKYVMVGVNAGSTHKVRDLQLLRK
jgi:hypothetical protein